MASKKTRSLICLCAAFLGTQACGIQLSRPAPVDPRAAQLDASSKPVIAGAPATALLAVEVEVSADSITPVSASVVTAPPPANAAAPDLQVVATEGGATAVDYGIIDPRLAEVDGEGRRILDRARTFVHVPLSATIDEVRLVPVEGRELVSKGGSFDPRPLARQACREERELPSCARILSAGGAEMRK